jgi:teichuronic acid exporter
MLSNKIIINLVSKTSIAQCIYFCSLPLLIYCYSYESFGVFAISSSIMWIFAVIATLQLEHIIPISKSKSTLYAISNICIKVNLTVVSLMLLLVALTNMFHNNLYGPMNAIVYLIPIGTLLIGILQLLRYINVHIGNFNGIGNALIITNLSTVSSALLLSMFEKYTANGLIISQLIGFLGGISVYLNKTNYKLILNPPSKINNNFIKIILLRGLKLTFAHGLRTLYGRMLIIIVSLENSKDIIGIYGIAERIVSAPAAVISRSISDIYRSKISKMITENQQYQNLLINTVKKSFLIGLLIFGIMLCTIYVFEKNTNIQREVPITVMCAFLVVGELFCFSISSIESGAISKNKSLYISMWNTGRILILLIYGAVCIIMKYNIYITLIAFSVIKIIFYIIDLGYQYRISKH